MKNLKRALSFALATVMLIGMMVVGASAASFGDADEIVNTDAVNTMVALGIIKGKDNGNFDPEGIVTRAEMAKMICVAMNGGKDPNLAGGGLYADTKGHWAAGYIDYCTNMGIVSGDTAGNFNPDKTVTGTEAAKMILIALGYNAETEKFVNDANWALNINIVANTKGLYEDLAILPSEGLTRDNAAQMLFNGMDANLVEYDYKLTTVNGELQTVAIAKDKAGPVDLLSEKFDMIRDEDVILTAVALDSKGTYTLDVDNVTTYTKVAADYTSLLGQKVDVLYKRGNTDKVYGVYATSDNQTVTYNMSAATDNSGKVKVNGKSYELDACATITDGVYSATPVTSSSLLSATSYNTVTLVDNDGDDKYEVAVITTVTPAKVTYVSATEIIAGGTSYKVADNNIATGLAKNDYVTVIYNVADDCFDIAKVDVTSGKVDGYKTGKILVDGTWYNFPSTEFVATDAGKTVEFCAVNGVVVAGTKDAVENSDLSNVVMLLEMDNATNLVSKNIKLLFADGTKKIVKLDTTSTGAVVPTYGSDEGKLYTYTETDYGYKLKAAAAIGDYAYDGPSSSNVVAASGSKITTIDTKYIADDAVIFVKTGAGAGKVITGKQLKNVNIDNGDNTIDSDAAINAYYVGTTGGMDRVVMAALASATTTFTAGNAAGKYALIVETAYKVDDDYITYKVWDGSEVVTVREKDTSVLSSRTQMALIKYSAIDGDVIKDVTGAGETKAAVLGLIGDEVSFDGSTMKKLTSDTVYMYYDSNKTAADEIGMLGGELQLADKVEGVAKQNVKYVLDGTDVEFVLIDVKNTLKDATTKAITLTSTITSGAANATAKFTDVNGDVLASPANLAAGTILNVEITGGTSDDTVEITFTAANVKCTDPNYSTGDDIDVAAGAKIVKTFVVTGAGTDTVTVADAT